ncbi:MAG: hypothetical protein IT392_13380 [Nitrospirae bacterium]|nr:hypothetical protein [Nitrospirota bacterium]
MWRVKGSKRPLPRRLIVMPFQHTRRVRGYIRREKLPEEASLREALGIKKGVGKYDVSIDRIT